MTLLLKTHILVAKHHDKMVDVVGIVAQNLSLKKTLHFIFDGFLDEFLDLTE